MQEIPAKTIITRKSDSYWFGTDYNMNLYKGCCHGCIYCDSRSDCYQIQDFDTVRVKENAIDLIHEELRKKHKTGVIGTGAMSDPYNPFEKQLQLTRQALQLIDTYHFGISIATKSNLIIRDIDLLQHISLHSPVICKITITSADDELSKKIEPGVCTSSDRFQAIKALSDAGIFTGILLMPLLPGLNDTEENIINILNAAYSNGARFVYGLFGLTLRTGQREYLYQSFDRLFPDQKLKQTYQKLYGASYECHSPKAKELSKVFIHECNRLNLLYQMEDIIRAYKAPYEYQQISIF